ncbi:MAG: guanylate kinase, partial [Clostridia bacterium]|nr:guanylate kinase [Clostridia bacterium]
VSKGTVIRRLRELDPGLIHSVSATTRAMRPGEIDGVSYHFVTRERFERMIIDGEVLEHDEYCGNYYGTPIAPLAEASAAGTDVVMDVTVPGSLAVMERMKDAVSIFLLPPSFSELRRRLEKRGTERPEEMERRLEKARYELGKASLFDYVVMNDDVDRAAGLILSITRAEKCRYRRVAGIEDTIIRK